MGSRGPRDDLDIQLFYSQWAYSTERLVLVRDPFLRFAQICDIYIYLILTHYKQRLVGKRDCDNNRNSKKRK